MGQAHLLCHCETTENEHKSPLAPYIERFQRERSDNPSAEPSAEHPIANEYAKLRY